MKKKQMTIEECVNQIQQGVVKVWEAVDVLQSKHHASVELFTDDDSMDLYGSTFVMASILLERSSEGDSEPRHKPSVSGD
jgi:hypothetical protein